MGTVTASDRAPTKTVRSLNSSKFIQIHPNYSSHMLPSIHHLIKIKALVLSKTSSLMLPVLSWAGGQKPVVKRNNLEKCTNEILCLKHHLLARCSGYTHMPHNSRRSKTGANLPQRYTSEALKYIILHCHSVGNPAEIHGISAGSLECTQEEVGVSKPPQDRLLISELTFGVQFISCLFKGLLLMFCT